MRTDAQKIKKWKEKKSAILLDHPFYKVGQFTFEITPNRTIDNYILGIFPNGVYVAASTKDKKVILVRQYKAGANSIMLEVPAGYCMDNELPIEAAKRELLEETGYRALTWRKLGSFYSNPSKERGGMIHLFEAKGAYKTSGQRLDENENIEVRILPQKSALEYVRKNRINSTASALAVLLALKK